MLALDRHRRLVSLFQAQESLRTVDVANTLGVTEETVRRDFEKLEAQGKLLRTHGGAVRADVQRREFDAWERSTQNSAEKQRIASAAAPLVKPGTTIFFDPSTTVLQMALLLPDLPLTVLTNSLQAVSALAEKPAIRTILLGGEIVQGSHSCVGWAALETLSLFHVDAAYISCRGIDALCGLSEATEEQARLKRRVVERAREVILLADHSKAGIASSYFFAQPSEIDTWITDQQPPADLLDSFATGGVNIKIAV